MTHRTLWFPAALFALALTAPAVVSLSACSGGAPPPPSAPKAVDPHLEATGRGPLVQLYRTAGTYTLPSHGLPAGLDPKQDVPVTCSEDEPKAQKAKNKKRSRVFRCTLPFQLAEDTRGYAPTGVIVRVDGKVIPFSDSDAVSSFGRTWRIRDGMLILSNPAEPTDVRMSYLGVEQAVSRHSLNDSGLAGADFVRSTLTLADQTRDGMILPAPAKAEWSVAIPAAKPMFEAWVALEPSPMFGYASDGAAVRLVVVADGQETVVDRYPLRAVAADFKNWRVNLEAFAGKTVTVRLESETAADPGGPSSPDFDWIFLGSPTIWGAPASEVRHVMVIGMDTTRPDHWSFYGYERPTTPNLDRILGESAVFTRAWAPAPRTRPSFRTATTGQYPLDAVGAKNIGAVFQEQGFVTAGFVANVHLVPRFDFDDGFDSWLFDGAAKADQQVDRALEWVKQNQDRDTYQFVHFMDPHIVYNAPGDFHDKFVTDPDPTLPKKFNRWTVIDWKKNGTLTPQRQAHIEALYDGEVAYMDEQLGRLVAEFDALPGKKLIVFHSDHGEEFWEHDTFEHNHTLYDEVTRAVLAVRPGVGLPEGRRIDTPATLADIAPTLYDYLAFPAGELPTGLDGLSLRPMVEARPADPAFQTRPLGVAHLRYSFERWGVVFQNHKYILWSGTGEEELYDLGADPAEANNLIGTATDLDVYRKALAAAHEMPVGPGWRIQASVVRTDDTPYVFTLPQPADDAFVLEPERTIAVRANEEWGETPKKVVADIGEVTLSDDKKTLTWKPGPKPTGGVIFVRFPAPVGVAGAAMQFGAEALPTETDAEGRLSWSTATMNITIAPGTVFVPPIDEAERMANRVSEDQRAMLAQLGYLDSDHGDHHDAPPAPPPGANPDGAPDDPTAPNNND
jgi:arylsulfatase A-like enzyme